MRSRGSRSIVLAALAAALCATVCRAEAGAEAESAGAEAETAGAEVESAGASSILKSLNDAGVWSCARSIDGVEALTACLEGKARQLFEESARDGEAQARSSGEYPMLERLADMGAALLPDSPLFVAEAGAKGEEGALGESERQQRSQRQEEELLLEGGDELGRGKKKKKRKALMKLLFVGMLIKNKLQLLLQVFGALLQIKFFGIAVLQLLLTLFRVYLDLAKKKEPQKVIYYEHAQHQHHYDHDHHYDDDHKGWGGLWGRSYEEPNPASKRIANDPGPDAQEQAYSNYYPRSA